MQKCFFFLIWNQKTCTCTFLFPVLFSVKCICKRVELTRRVLWYCYFRDKHPTKFLSVARSVKVMEKSRRTMTEIEVWWGKGTEQKNWKKLKNLKWSLHIYIGSLENIVLFGIYPLKANQPLNSIKSSPEQYPSHKKGHQLYFFWSSLRLKLQVMSHKPENLNYDGSAAQKWSVHDCLQAIRSTKDFKDTALQEGIPNTSTA